MTGESCCDFHHLLTNLYTDDLWMLMHISLAPALPYELVHCSPSVQLAGPTYRDVTTWFRLTIMKCAVKKTLKMHPGVQNISCPLSGKLNIKIREI
jgi:hypothetical protein